MPLPKKPVKPAAKTAAAKPAAKAAPAKKTSAAVTAMQEARKKAAAARAAGAPAKKTPAGAKGPISFKAPVDFKPAFFEVEFETLRDGLIRGGSVVMNRVKGKWDNPDAKRFDLSAYDNATLLGVASRLGIAAFAPNVLKRLPPKTKFGLILRANKKAATGTLAVAIKAMKRLGVAKNDKPKWFWLTNQSEGADLLTYRKIRKLNRLLSGAFVEVQLPPTTRRGKKAEDSEE